jgi:hypothetical protein
LTYLLSTEARDLGLVPQTDALDRAKAEAKIEGAAVCVRDELTDDLVYSVDPRGSFRGLTGGSISEAETSFKSEVFQSARPDLGRAFFCCPEVGISVRPKDAHRSIADLDQRVASDFGDFHGKTANAEGQKKTLGCGGCRRFAAPGKAKGRAGISEWKSCRRFLWALGGEIWGFERPFVEWRNRPFEAAFRRTFRAMGSSMVRPPPSFVWKAKQSQSFNRHTARTCWPSTRGRAILIARWFASTRPQSNSPPRRACRSR